MQTLGMMLDATARWFPERPFVIFEGESITYGEFNRRAARLAGLLSSLGIRKGTPVGLYLPSTPEIAIAYHACQKIGAIALPISDSYKSNRSGVPGPPDPDASGGVPGRRLAGHRSCSIPIAGPEARAGQRG